MSGWSVGNVGLKIMSSVIYAREKGDIIKDGFK